MINHVTLMGRLTRNPEIRYTQNNKPVASYTLAVDRGFKDQNGNSITDFIPCVAWGKIAGFAQDYLYKGTLIAVEGRLEQRNWTDKNGNKRTTYEVIVSQHHFCESKAAAAAHERPPHPADCTPPPESDDFTEMPDDGEVPF